MTTSEFRCEQCGKLLSVETREGQAVKCPHCKKRMTVPEGLTSLPRPRVPGIETPSDSLREELVEEPAINKTMTAMMPWVMSVFLHLGVGLIAGFFTFWTVQHVNPQTPAEAVYVPGEDYSPDPGGVENPGDFGSETSARQDKQPHEMTGYLHNDSTVTGTVGKTGETASLISAGGAGGTPGGGWAQFGPGSGGHGRFFGHGGGGPGGNAHHVVYCIDASGSMAMASRNGGSVFDVVREEMLKSIGHLAPVQDFHIVMFQEGPVIEMPARRLMPVTPENRIAAAHWLNDVIPHGAGSDPIPALNRCFDVLARGDTTRKGKQIFLLTDGAFPDNDAVLRCVKERNKAHDVHVYTFLYGEQDDQSAIKMMRDIANQTGGRYKNIQD